MKERSITLNGVELKRVFDIELSLGDELLKIHMHYDKRLKEYTQLQLLSDFVFRQNCLSGKEEISTVTLFIPLDSTRLNIIHNIKFNEEV